MPTEVTPLPATLTLRHSRLARLRARDPSAEGVFWCSVVTTGVYCRPTCPSRLARPEHIRFHDSLGEARRTGFRPCRRCRPEERSLGERHREVVAAACNMIDDLGGAPSLAVLARTAGMSQSHFHRLFKRVTGVTPKQYAEEAAA